MQRIPGLYVATTETKGRGVFTAADIPEGALIEICPVIVIPETEVTLIHRSVLHDYYYWWDRARGTAAIALGFGSIYNHATEPNSACHSNIEERTLSFYALRHIGAGEEITIEYTDSKPENPAIWFDPT